MTFEFSFILIGLMEIFSHFVQGCTGFGATVIAAPVVTGLLGVAEGVPYGTLITMPMLYILGIMQFKKVDWKNFAKIVVFMAPGVLFGNYMFRTINATQAKVAIGFIVTCIALYNIYKTFYLDPRKGRGGDVEEEKPDTPVKKGFRYVCLLAGGAVHGAFNIGGPLVTVYSIFSIKDKTAFRATMTWVWIVINTCFNMVNQYTAGVWTPRMWSALAIGVPLAAVGFYLGHLFHTKINHSTFLKFVFIVLLIVGGDMFVRALMALMAA